MVVGVMASAVLKACVVGYVVVEDEETLGGEETLVFWLLWMRGGMW